MKNKKCYTCGDEIAEERDVCDSCIQKVLNSKEDN